MMCCNCTEKAIFRQWLYCRTCGAHVGTVLLCPKHADGPYPARSCCPAPHGVLAALSRLRPGKRKAIG